LERFAIGVLKQATIRAACEILEISWDQAWHILHRFVGSGQGRKKRRVIAPYGVDEKSSGSGQDYVAIICH
jgi:hypothetical protein